MKIAGIGCGGLVGLVIILGIIGAIISPAKKAVPTAATAPIAASSGPTPTSDAPPTTAPPTTPPPSPSPAQAAPSPSLAPSTAKAASATKAAAPKAAPSPTGCDPGPDVIVWYRVPTLQDEAQLLGSRGYPNCSSTFDMIQSTSPTDPGECTEAAWASDNPGYDADATPAKRLKKVQVSVGPAC